MSKLKAPSPSIHKPPLAESASRIPASPRRSLRSTSTCTANLMQTTPVSLMKTQIPNRLSGAEESELRPEYQSISCDLRALADMVKDEFGNHQVVNIGSTNTMNIDPTVVYERGRLYEEYSARRNERLRRKKGVTGKEKKKTPYSLGVTIESGKKRDSMKLENLRKSVPANFSVTETPRYSLRSSTCKENKKPPLDPVVDSEPRTGARRIRRI